MLNNYVGVAAMTYRYWSGQRLVLIYFWLERRYGIFKTFSDRWMSNGHFGMLFVPSFYIIVWKMIIKVVKEGHNYFYQDHAMASPNVLWVSSVTSAFALYKQEHLSFVVEMPQWVAGYNNQNQRWYMCILTLVIVDFAARLFLDS